MSGYSATPLARKLGIAPGMRVALIGAPDGFADLLELPDDVRLGDSLRGAPLDVILFFTISRGHLARNLTRLRRGLDPAGGLWIAWPKRQSGVPTDISDQVLRELILPTGLVDNKVCAIDEIWSGLRFVVRVADRPARAPRAPA